MSATYLRRKCCCGGPQTVNLYYCKDDAWTGYHTSHASLQGLEYNGFYVNGSPPGTPQYLSEPYCYDSAGNQVQADENGGYYDAGEDSYIEDCSTQVRNPDYNAGDCCYGVAEPLRRGSKDADDFFVASGGFRCGVTSCCTDWRQRIGGRIGGVGGPQDFCAPRKVTVSLSGAQQLPQWLLTVGNYREATSMDGTQQFRIDGEFAPVGNNQIVYPRVGPPCYPNNVNRYFRPQRPA